MAAFKWLGAVVIATAITVVGCGPGNPDTNVRIRTEEPTTGNPDTVVQNNVIVHNNTDTVVRENTIIQKQTDTVIRNVPGNTSIPVSPEEQRKIDTWLSAHTDSLNEYGDPKNMAYTGGTPLFNEATGKQMTKYEYIVMKHPDRPWM